MNRRLAIRMLAAAGAGSLFRGWLKAGPPPQPPQPDRSSSQDFTLHSEARLVLLDVSVKDRKGGFVADLTKDDFTVLEDGRPQQITIFDNGDVPVTAGILVDESRSMTSKRNDVLSAATTLVEESNPRDEIFVLNFNEKVKRGLPEGVLFSGDLGQLSAALYRGQPEGRTALYDAIMAGLRQIELGKREKKILVAISDGGDNASIHSRRAMLDAVERSIATIYTIGVYDPDDPERDTGVLRQLAHISGGEAFFPAAPSEAADVCRRIAKEIRTRYTIGYRPEARGDRKQLRHIRVQAASPAHGRLSVLTRTSYRYDNEAQNKQALALD
jgi:VWFA-related protein